MKPQRGTSNKHLQELAAIRADTDAIELGMDRLYWALARTVPDAIARVATDRIERMKAQSEPFRRSGTAQHQRAAQEIIVEETRTRQRAAAVARFNVEPAIGKLRERVQKFAKTIGGDALETLPNALDGLDPGAMLQWHILRELRRELLQRLPLTELLPIYRAALQTGDAAALIDVQLIEDLAMSQTAGSDGQRPAAKELREMVSGVRKMRVPPDIIEIEATIGAAQTAVSRADLVQIHPIDPQHDAAAKAAHEAETSAYAAEAQR